MDVIILAGGLGTRLQSVVSDIPKCMAPIAGKPFLWYILKYLTRFEINRIVLSVGYLKDVIIDWIDQSSDEFPFDFDYAIETEPLGTGGGIRLALKKCASNEVIVLNGDTFFEVELDELYQNHCLSLATISLALKPMKQFDRYGAVEMDEHTNRIKRFNEKAYCKEGFINGGVYVIDKQSLNIEDFPERFSFETKVLEPKAAQGKVCGFECEGYFVDIGIPQDYAKANKELPFLFKYHP